MLLKWNRKLNFLSSKPNIRWSKRSSSEQSILPNLKNGPVWSEQNIFDGEVLFSRQKEETVKEKPFEERKPQSNLRYNDFGIQMISEDLYSQLFKDKTCPVDEKKIKNCIEDLKSYGLLKKQNPVDGVSLKLPPFVGSNLEEHFYNIAEHQSAPYRELLISLTKEIPPAPNEWLLQPGWTKYTQEGCEAVDFPLEDALVFDVEVCCQRGEMPTVATAVSRNAWYGWVSRDVISCSNNALPKSSYSTDHLIPLESGPKVKGNNATKQMLKPRLVVGHNVSFDRARVKEQYWLKRTGLKFVDTLSLHVCVSGITSHQKALLKAGLGEDEWSKLTSLNSLSKVHELYCGVEVSKDDRELFVTGSLDDIKENFQIGMEYCSRDVIATHSVLKELLPLFLSRFPHPVTLAGMLELQSCYVPVNKHWTRYLDESQQAYEDFNLEAKSLLTQSAYKACHLLHDNKYLEDLWLWDQDWSVKHLTLKKAPSAKASKLVVETSEDNCKDSFDEKYEAYREKFKEILDKHKLVSTRAAHLPGYPAWYRKLCMKDGEPDWAPGPELLSTGMQVAPKLLQLTWKSMPLHYVRGSGWGYMVPFDTSIPIEPIEKVPLKQLVEHCKRYGEILCSCEQIKGQSIESEEQNYLCCKRKINLDGIFCKAEIGSGCGLVKLPHKDGAHLNVGNPLARDFINKYSENGLSSSFPFALRIIEISRMLSYWRNNRERIEKQLVCWLGKQDLPIGLKSERLGAILPQVIVCGTLTRRAVEPTWMTASNSIPERIGSELRGIVQAPPGFSFVGADVDSQELWIASLLGDAYAAGLHGATPLGWMTLNGQKSDGTDMHSVTAKAVGISRSDAKVLNYARIYGAGQRFAERLLKQFNSDMDIKEAQEKAAKMYSLTKGEKVFPLKEDILPEVGDRFVSKSTALEFSFLYKKSLDELVDTPQWQGGMESSMFNCLEGIARMPSPETPFLKCKLSRALEPGLDQDDKNLPTRINWVVQSGAVDFLHLMLVCMRWLLGHGPRFCLSFHDEVRYLVPNEMKYQASLALHVTNLLTRAFCVSRLGMTDLPQSIAFFSSVEIDTALRKEASDDNKTPSNPHGLSKGYGIPKGESLNIYEAIQKSGGSFDLKTRKKVKRISKTEPNP